MSEVFFRDLGLPKPKYRFDLGGGSHGEMTGRQLMAIEQALQEERPDVCLVYGDTNSTLAGALAAAKLHIPVAHVEAGLRSFNKRMPEEVNRVLTDHVSRWLFTPTAKADENLLREGFAKDAIFRVGDVMYDVTRLVIDDPKRQTSIISDLGLSHGNYAVATLHRQENTDSPERLTAILSALAELAHRMPVILPIHPRTAKMVAATPGAASSLAKLKVLDPVGFFDMATLLSGAVLAVTDSGGLQKEAFFHRVPCVTVREETDWGELVQIGWNRLPAVIDAAAITAANGEALATPAPEDVADPYGGGDAAEKVLDTLTT